MSDRKFIIPEYGPFAGMRVITSGSLIAMPFAATMLADFGAEVIHIERPGVGDTLRMLAPFAEVNGKKVGTAWAQDARNKLSLTLELNLNHPEVKELFYGLIREADIFMENMVWLDKLGIYDDEMLKVNPKLVIVHISGLGNAKFGGVPSVCNRASYDMIGQAFSGWLYLQGFKDRDPVVAKPYMNDFVSAFAALFGTLAAYNVAQKTGKGQVVDVAQFEAMAQYMCGTYTSYTMAGAVTERSGNASPAFQPYDLFEPAQSAGAAGVRAGVLPARLRAVLRRHCERAAQGGSLQAGYGHALPQRRKLHALADPRARRRRVHVRHRPLRHARHCAHGGHCPGHGAGAARFARRSGRALRLLAACILRQGIAGQGAAVLLARRAGAAAGRFGAGGRLSRAARS